MQKVILKSKLLGSLKNLNLKSKFLFAAQQKEFDLKVDLSKVGIKNT